MSPPSPSSAYAGAAMPIMTTALAAASTNFMTRRVSQSCGPCAFRLGESASLVTKSLQRPARVVVQLLAGDQAVAIAVEHHIRRAQALRALSPVELHAHER